MNAIEEGFAFEAIDWSNKLVMIAEDDALTFRLLRNYLKRTQAKIIWAQNGREAVEMLLANPDVEIALMDIQMPEMSGIEATIQIRKINKNLPVIIQTAYGLPEHKEACLMAGCNDFIAKPFEMAELLDSMKKFINN
ncbi:MAG: response regulator [Bacteroidales bacterium]|jgi:CheY-like chemotaxis protein|nr:response regulator [Bacteroidales bacterium]